jgi:hypothetical protein
MTRAMTGAQALLVSLVLAGGCARVTELLVPREELPDAAAGEGAAAGPWNCGPRCLSVGLGDAPAGSFAGAVSDLAPQLVYPLAGAIIPPNLPPPVLQWRRDPAEALFRISLAAERQRYDLYVACEAPSGTMTAPPAFQCGFTPPEAVWRSIAAESAGQRVQVTISSTARPGAAVSTSAPSTFAFAATALEGGVYYWSYADNGIHRARFDASAASPFIAPNSAANAHACGGCHVVSRDGATIAFGADDPGYLTVARAAAPAQPLVAPATPPEANASTMSLTADGSLLAVSYGGNGDDAGHLVVREAAGGRVVAALDPTVLGTAETRVFFPEWSPDGAQIAVTLASRSLEPRTVSDGYLAVIPYDGGRFGAARVVVPRGSDGLIHFAASWSPDQQYLLFVSASAPSRLMNDVSYDNPSARLRLVRADGTGGVSELGRVNQGGGHTAGWPRFVASSGGGPWVFTFHAKLDYGWLLANHEVAGPKGGLSQLWLGTIDPALLPADPSSAPVWLPLQDVHHINNMAFPAPIVCAPAILPPEGCGPGEICANGRCVPARP